MESGKKPPNCLHSVAQRLPSWKILVQYRDKFQS